MPQGSSTRAAERCYPLLENDGTSFYTDLDDYRAWCATSASKTQSFAHGSQQAFMDRTPQALIHDRPMPCLWKSRGKAVAGAERPQTLPSSPYQNAKKEALERRMLALLEVFSTLNIEELK
jgi:hypothetical protein